MPPRERKPGPAEQAIVDDLAALRLATTGVLVQLALRLARRVDSGKFTASDAQQLRLTWAQVREEARPVLTPLPDADAATGTDQPAGQGMTALERARARRAAEEEARRGGAGT